MSGSRWAKIIVDLKRELARIENSSCGMSSRLEILQREAESLKTEFLAYALEKQRKALASQRGLGLLIRDRKKIRTSLAVAAGGLILGGLIAKDKHAALNAGLSGFNGVLQGFGETKWVVSLRKELVTIPYNDITAKGVWVTFESLIVAIHDLKTEALKGKLLGTFDNIIQILQQSRGKLIYIAPPNRN
jgi:hypothetical protein